MRKIFLLLVCAAFLAGCTSPGRGEYNVGTFQAYVPVYAKPTDVTNIGVEPAKTIQKPGKIYVIGSILLQNDVNKGVHIINISNPRQPQKLAFLRVPWSTEIVVKDNYLYVNNYNDLLVFSLTDVQNPALVKRIANVFPYHYNEYPPQQWGYFECVDPSKGIVVDWELRTVTNPKCRR
jgi:hypothetical protein